MKTWGSYWRYYRDEPALTYNDNIIDFPNDKYNSMSFKFKQQIKGQTRNNGARDVKIKVPLTSLSSCWRTLEMQLINCEISLILIWS